MTLRVVSVNVEQDKHYERVLPFLASLTPDVTCIQEIFEEAIPRFEEACGPCVSFTPLCLMPREDGAKIEGIALFSRKHAVVLDPVYYVGSRDSVREDDGHSDVGTHAIVGTDIDGVRILTTHFTWTPNGQPTPKQEEDLGALLSALEGMGEFALMGDFNAPRGGATFATLAARYKDNIPPEYAGSIDPELHKTRDNPVERERVSKYMVDGLFTTPGVVARDVRLAFGVSDHAAIVSTIEKAA